MVQWVYEKAVRADLDEVIVATDDQRILDAVLGFGGKAVMTATNHKSGTDRCAEVAGMQQFSDFAFIVNIQGDEPGITPALINAALALLRSDENIRITTLATRIVDAARVTDPNVVKVVFDKSNRALYFSRSPLPYVRDGGPATHYSHIGLYAFRREALLEAAQLQQSQLEMAEQLEQLRWLENGLPIGVALVHHHSISIDTPADLEAFKNQAG